MILAVVAGICLLLCLLVLSKVTVQLQVVINNARPELSFEVFSFFRLIRWRRKWPHSDHHGPVMSESSVSQPRLEPNVQSSIRQRYTVQDIREVWRMFRWFLRHVSCLKWEASTLFGTGQANTTGTLAGYFWALQGELLFLMSRALKMVTKPKVMIRPDFERRLWIYRFDCIVSFRIGYAILAGIRFFIYWCWLRRRWCRKINERTCMERTCS